MSHQLRQSCFHHYIQHRQLLRHRAARLRLTAQRDRPVHQVQVEVVQSQLAQLAPQLHALQHPLLAKRFQAPARLPPARAEGPAAGIARAVLARHDPVPGLWELAASSCGCRAQPGGHRALLVRWLKLRAVATALKILGTRYSWR